MKILLTVIGSLLLLNVSAQQYDALKKTAHPVMGKKLNINYVADSTVLSSAMQVSGKAYFYSKTKLTADEQFTLEKKKDSWNGVIKIPDSTIFVSLVFSTPEGKIVDNNRNRGYLIPVYKKNGPVQFAYARMADLLGGGPPDAAGLKKDQRQALVFMKEEMHIHPESEVELRSVYYNMLANSPERGDKVELLKKLNDLKSDQEEELMMAQLYLSYFGGKRQADSLDRLLMMKFPNGNYVKNKTIQAQRSANKAEVEPHGTDVRKNSVSMAEVLKNVQDNLVDEPVAPLTLKDIDGNVVNIDAIAGNGKVTVIDFWATWCKPCIASFPALQRVMEQYRNNPSVQFFFICTMEQGDAVKNAKAFMAKNPYPFKVLMDEKTEDMNMYKAYSAYKATGGIPYKLVIDGRGHVRSRTSGFSGNEEALIAELSAMINIALKSGK